MYPIKFFFFNLLNVLDLVTTLKGLSLGFTETNPLMNLLLIYPDVFLVSKIIVIYFVSILLFIHEDKKLPRFQRFLGDSCIVLYSWVVIRNVIIITS